MPLAVPPAGLYERYFSLDGQPTTSRTIQLPDGTAKGKSAVSRCDEYEFKFDFNMEIYLDQDVSSQGRAAAGNAAASWFRKAKNLGCGWVQAYL